MLKCILIYLWIYIGIYYVIEAAADADEHVHIKLHMPRGQRKHTHQHHTHHKKRQLPVHYNSAPVPPREPPQLYHETPHNYLTGITTPQQHNLHRSQQHTKKLPTSHLYESIGQLLEADDGYSSNDADTAAADTEDEEHMAYLAENIALFPHPSTSTTYESELLPQNLPDEVDEEDNEISRPAVEGHDSELIMFDEEPDNYHRHRPYAAEFTSSMKNEQQFLRQIYQQQQEQQQQQHNQFEQADFMKTAKLRGNKYKKGEKQYHSEDDMTESMIYTSLPQSTVTTFAKGNNDKVGHSGGGFKSLTVDDIWSQLQRQYLSKYVPQAQPLIDGVEDGVDGGDGVDEDSLKPTTKRKRTTIRQKHIKPDAALSSSTSSRQPTSSFWPAKSLNYENNHQQKAHYSFSPSPTFSALTTSSRDTELFDDTRPFRRPYNKFNAVHQTDSGADVHGAAGEDDDDDGVRIKFNNADNADVVDDENNNSHDSSFEENVYQRGKKYVGNTGHVAYGHGNVNNPFNYHDLYGAFSTPITATVATKVHPSTYHPKLTRASASSSPTPSFYGDSVSPTLSHESTSYQWLTQQHNPDSYHSYHSHHQQEPPQQHLQHQHRLRQFQPQSSALRLPKATIAQMPSTASTATISSTFASSLSPTISNDFTSSPATKSSIQPSRYKKRKNRIKSKKTRIVLV